MTEEGFEPPTHGLWFHYSTTELYCLLEKTWLEQATFRMQSECSTNWTTPPSIKTYLVGLEPTTYWAETSYSIQLSYRHKMVWSGLEPPTNRFSVYYSNQLSYLTNMGQVGFEPTWKYYFISFTGHCLQPLSHHPINSI